MAVSILKRLPEHLRFDFGMLALSRFLTHRTRGWCPSLNFETIAEQRPHFYSYRRLLRLQPCFTRRIASVHLNRLRGLKN